MWVVAGILLGLVVVGVLAGFHAGPHAHAVASGAGILAAVWLIVMILLGQSQPLLYVLLGADLTISSVVGFAAYKALREGAAAGEEHRRHPVEGQLGRVVEALDPAGIVRVAGEDWTAVSLNGPVPAGGRVQVVSVRGVRLEVWGEDLSALQLAQPADEEAAK